SSALWTANASLQKRQDRLPRTFHSLGVVRRNRVRMTLEIPTYRAVFEQIDRGRSNSLTRRLAPWDEPRAAQLLHQASVVLALVVRRHDHRWHRVHQAANAATMPAVMDDQIASGVGLSHRRPADDPHVRSIEI